MVREIFRCLHCGQFRGIILRVDIREREREREFYLQLHCRHTRRAISPSKLVPILSNTYNERYTKENIHRQRKQTNEEKKTNYEHIQYRDKQGLQAVYNIINDNFVTNYTDKNE